MTGADAAVAAARLAEAAAGALLFGAPLLLRLARTPREDAPFERALLQGAAALLAAGSLAALLSQTAGMAGSLAEGLAPSTLLGVTAETGFGRSVAVRVATAGAVLALTAGRRPPPRAAAAALGAVALASLAWSGHGAADAGARGVVHLATDATHLLAAGAWLGALAAMAGLLARAAPGAAAALHAFSGVGTAVVAALLASGAGNAWFLAGPQGLLRLPSDAWGRLLLVKLGLFAAMLGLAALNRWRWTPALLQRPGGPPLAALRRSVAAEGAAGLAVLAVAAVMGGLAPPMAQT